MRTILLALTLSATSLQAQCVGDRQLFVSCQIKEQTDWLQVCYDADAAYYRFGPESGPAELALTEAYDTLGYMPWPGVGRAIWESLTFHNGDYSYTVYGAFDRMFDDETEADHPTPHSGGVTVIQGEDTIAELSCDRATTQFIWPDEIHGYKQAAGFDWDDRARAWVKRN